MATSVYLSVPLKTTIPVDLVKPLGKFIKNSFMIKPDDHQQELNDFNKLRNQVISKLKDKPDESTLDVLYRYYDQLKFIEPKLPINETEIRVNFKWWPVFKESGLFPVEGVSITSGSYDKVCILFNIAALLSQLGEKNKLDSDDGLKTSAKYFQQASGIFSHLSCNGFLYSQTPTADISYDALSALSALMVAQAQDCFFKKARKDGMKSSIIAKIALECSDLYSEASTLMSHINISNLWPKEWRPFVAGRQAAFHGLAEFYQAKLCAEKSAYGEQIARLQHASELMSASETDGGNTFKFADERDRVKRELVAAKKDNDSIYNETVPSVKNLAPIGKAHLAKRLPLSEPRTRNNIDLFKKFVPMVVHQAVGVFDADKAEIINTEVGRLLESRQFLNGVLASLNLPAAIEDLTGGKKLPQSILDKAAKICQLGGGAPIDTLMQDLPDVLQRNQEILDECSRVLDDEAKSDQQLRDQFKERWTPKPSAELVEMLRAEITKYKSILDNAVHADIIVKDKYHSLRRGMDWLSKSPGDLESRMPPAAQQAQLNESPTVKQLRSVMQKVHKHQTEREALTAEFKRDSGDYDIGIVPKFMAALTPGLGKDDLKQISDDELHTIFGPLGGQVNDSLQQQEALLAEVQQAYEEFERARQSNQSTSERDKILKELAETYDGYMELKNNLEEGNNFYNDLIPVLVRCQVKINDLCFARKTEADDLVKDLQQPQQHQQPPQGTARCQPPTPGPPPRKPPPPRQPTGPNAPVPPSHAAARSAPRNYTPAPYTAPPCPGQYQPQ